MKKILFYSLCALSLYSCSKDKDLYNPSAEIEAAVNQNVQKVFGTTFDPNQDWRMLFNSQVEIVANAEETEKFKVAKVQVLTDNPFVNPETKILNECEAKAGQKVKMGFDAPNYLDTLYAACVSKEGYYRVTPFAVGKELVSFREEAAQSRGARRAPAVMPKVISDGRNSDNVNMMLKPNKSSKYNSRATREDQWENSGWADKFYDIETAIENVEDFTKDEKNELFKTITGIMPENTSNLEKVLESEYFINTANYFYADGTQKPITITPVRCGADLLGWESLYYYYYNPAEVEGKSDAERALFLKSLPKFKLLECADALVGLDKGATVEERVAYAKKNYSGPWRDVTRRSRTYTLAYFGDGEPTNGTQGSYQFPAGYRIGLMFRVDSVPEHPTLVASSNNTAVLSAVNFYADSLLNNEANLYGKWYYGWNSALRKTMINYLGENKSRAAVFSANGKTFIGFEDLVDQDFNDVVFEVNGGVTLFEDSIQLDKNVYTMAFEDQRLGDYDMNDVVIKAQRIDLTHVKFSLEATGADFDLYLRNIDGQKLDTVTEVHDIFAKYSHIDQQGSANDTGEHRFINTVMDWPHYAAVQEVIEVPADFTFSEDKYLPYIYNKTKGYDVHIARRGEDPHAIIIPVDWRYPREYICVGGIEKKIKVAYPQFNNWGEKQVDETDWYLYPNEELIYTKSIFK